MIASTAKQCINDTRNTQGAGNYLPMTQFEPDGGNRANIDPSPSNSSEHINGGRHVFASSTVKLVITPTRCL